MSSESIINAVHLVGNHGAGKTELARILELNNGIHFVDTGPLVREEFARRSGPLADVDIKTFVELIEKNAPGFFTRKLLGRVYDASRCSKVVTIVGMRAWDAIEDIARVEPAVVNHIIWIEADTDETLRLRVNRRDGKNLTDVEFKKKLDLDASLGLLEIKARAFRIIQNPSGGSPEDLYNQGKKALKDLSLLCD